ncbi:MAG TPA: protein translocase subunit SecF [Thermoanaerobaculia bacterium]|nr:protein translocase subunit SecF [Thermoanaerobaculia bacterium]
MRLLRDTNIDFMKYRKFWITVSLVLIAVFFFAYFTIHLHLGIDFAGGTQLTLRFREQPQVDQLRSLLAAAGMGEAEIQRFDRESLNEVMIKTPVSKGQEEGSRDRVVNALNRRYNQGQEGRLDLNRAGEDAIVQLLLAADPDGLAAQGAEARRAHYAGVAKALLGERRKDGLFPSWNAVAGTPGLSAAALGTLKARGSVGDYAVLGTENVGPQIGKELRRQGFLAVVMSLLGMLVYIWLRFELRFGIGAVMASIHDVLVTLGLFILMGFEFNLTTIAAFLTLSGYSMNDTVVIFDRIRENMRKSRRKPLVEVMNESINQTLSRTIMTSGLTMLTVAALLALGGDVLRGFAFVMTVGIIVGTYSSIYIASPFALLWEQLFGAAARERREKAASAAAPAAGGAGVPGGAAAGSGKPARPAGAQPSSPRAASSPKRRARR